MHSAHSTTSRGRAPAVPWSRVAPTADSEARRFSCGAVGRHSARWALCWLRKHEDLLCPVSAVVSCPPSHVPRCRNCPNITSVAAITTAPPLRPRPRHHLAAAHRPPRAHPRRTCSRCHTRPPSQVPRRRTRHHTTSVPAVAPSPSSPPRSRHLATVATLAPPPHPPSPPRRCPSPTPGHVFSSPPRSSLCSVRRQCPLRRYTDPRNRLRTTLTRRIRRLPPHWMLHRR